MEVSNRHRIFGLVYIEVANVWRGQSQSEKTSTVSTVNCPRIQRKKYMRVSGVCVERGELPAHASPRCIGWIRYIAASGYSAACSDWIPLCALR